jgi:hypothetical protein
MKRIRNELLSSLNKDLDLKKIRFLQEELNKILFLNGRLYFTFIENHKYNHTHRGLTISFEKEFGGKLITFHIGLKRVGKPKDGQINNFNYELRFYYENSINHNLVEFAKLITIGFCKKKFRFSKIEDLEMSLLLENQLFLFFKNLVKTRSTIIK